MEEKSRRSILYANSVEFSAQVYDFKLDFDMRMQDEIVEGVSVIMSPQHFKAMAKLMMNAVSEYETNIGIINLPVNTTSDAKEENL